MWDQAKQPFVPGAAKARKEPKVPDAAHGTNSGRPQKADIGVCKNSKTLTFSDANAKVG